MRKQRRRFALSFSLNGQCNSSTFYIQNFQSLAIFCARTARFVSNIFGNHIVGFLMTRLILKFDLDMVPVKHCNALASFYHTNPLNAIHLSKGSLQYTYFSILSKYMHTFIFYQCALVDSFNFNSKAYRRSGCSSLSQWSWMTAISLSPHFSWGSCRARGSNVSLYK